jgi:hypothetical protein
MSRYTLKTMNLKNTKMTYNFRIEGVLGKLIDGKRIKEYDIIGVGTWKRR